MTDKKPHTAITTSVDQFLQQLANTPAVQPHAGRLIFALDATASRQPTWDRASQLQGDMFKQTRALGSLAVQLCFYRGYRDFRASPWHHDASALLQAAQTVRCAGGQTQITRLLRHALAEHRRNPINAVVFIGDALEEALDPLCELAGQLGLQGVPLFLFQECQDPQVAAAFAQLARLSSGAHCQFDHHSAARLGELLNAVAVYATGGKKALQQFLQPSLQQSSPALEDLRRQLLEGPHA